MKGIIFAELVRFMEQAKSPEFADQVIEAANIPSGGAFTTVGNYDHAEALALVGKASELSGIEVGELCRLFGNYIYGRFLVLYPHIMAAYRSSEALLEHVGSHIHNEVVILYPDAKPPRVLAQTTDGVTVLSYESHRPMAAIAYGLVQGCMEHFKDDRPVSFVPSADHRSATITIGTPQHG